MLIPMPEPLDFGTVAWNTARWPLTVTVTVTLAPGFSATSLP